MTVNPYDAKTSKKSLAIRFNAAFVDIRVANPTKPTNAIANPNSIPVMNKTNTTARAISPTVTSYIVFPLEYFYDIAHKHQAQDKAANPHSVSNRIKRHLQSEGNLT